MRPLVRPALLLCVTVLLTAQGPAQEATPPAGSLKCEQLLPSYRTDDTRVVTDKIAPAGANAPTGNTFFMMRRPVKYVIVHLTPLTSDTAPYAVKLITRYTDDTLYEASVELLHPEAGNAVTWGPLPTKPAKVPASKIADVFNVKVQENYLMDPQAKGFSYTLSVDGCN